MTKLSIQFHADPREFAERLLPHWISGADLQLVGQRDAGDDSSWYPVELEDAASLRDTRRFMARVSPFVGFEGSDAEFMESNPGSLIVTPGRLVGDKLLESFLGAFTDDLDALRRYKAVVAKARRSLQKGAVLIDATGAQHPVPSHLYSLGARKLQASGVRIVAAGGGNEYLLPAAPE